MSEYDSEQDFMNRYNLKKAENPKDYQIDIQILIKELQERIDKAIEYIESYNLPEDLGKLSECPISVNELKELLDILKGGNNE